MERQNDLAPGFRHFGQLNQTRQRVDAALEQVVEFRLNFVFFAFRAVGQLGAKLLFDAVEFRRRIGVNRDRDVAEHRFRARRRDGNELRLAFLRVDDRVIQVPKVSGDRFVEHFVVADRRLERDVPVDEAFAAVNQPFGEEFIEEMTHRLRANVVEREALTAPVATAAERFNLPDDAALILIFPVPNPLNQRFATEIPARFPFEFEETAFDDRLRRDPGVVDARNPKRLVTLHPLHSHQRVLKRVVQRVPHMERAGNVRRRDNDRKRLFILIDVAVKEALFFPKRRLTLLRRLMVVLFRQIVDQLFLICHNAGK